MARTRLLLAFLALGALALAGGALAAHDLTAALEGPATALDATPFNITVRADNVGDATTSSVEAQLFVDGAPNATLIDLGPLAADANGTSVQTLSLACGAHWINVTVDPSDTVPETNESNNTASMRVVVLPFVNFTSLLSGTAGSITLTLNATASHGCAPLNFTWQVGTATYFGPLVTLTPPAGNLSVDLTVRDSGNTSLASASGRVVAIPNAPPVLTVLVPDTTILTLVPLGSAIEADDPDGAVVSYFVNFGDGNTTFNFGEAAAYVYHRAGSFTFTVIVTDNLGATNTSTVALEVTNRPPVADSEFDFWVTTPAKEVTFNASRSSDPEGFPLTITWQFGDDSYGTGAVVKHAYATAGSYTAKVTVTDVAGATHEVEITVRVEPAGADSTLPIVGGAALALAALALLLLLLRRRKKDEGAAPGEDSSVKPPSP